MVYIVCNCLITILVILLIWAVICTIDIAINYEKDSYPRWNWIRWIEEKLEKRGFYDGLNQINKKVKKGVDKPQPLCYNVNTVRGEGIA